MGTIELKVLWCTGCRAEREFEQPPCGDGHGSDCPELTCTMCGEALLGPSAFPELASAPAQTLAS